MHWQKITVIGVGLLGGSIGLAIKRRGLAKRVSGYVRRTASIEECQKAGAVDEATCDLACAVENADVVILCTPLSQMRVLTEQMLPALKRDAIVTDVGSVKESIVQQLGPLVAKAGARFIGSHPMAGAEKMGVGAARPDLFNDAACVITPTRESSARAVEAIREFWQLVGARPLLMSPELHDEFVSRSSHLVHIVAAELANYVLNPTHPKEQALLCANGFRDTTRVASGSPDMWRDIALANRKNLSRVLGVFIEDLQEFQAALGRADGQAVQDFFEQAKRRRDQWLAQPASPSPE
ncbi:MAG: prephenate dehydrogenase/arogenate dehydrogenase family protein [Verrucomicrobiales bacterium]|nr:prephenate dehydrogenase/arogenate dehydrogenase family protein [Verrucomicrobiales bacterium]